MSSSVIVPSWLDDLFSEVAPSLLESEDADSLDPVSVDCTSVPETVLVVRS